MPNMLPNSKPESRWCIYLNDQDILFLKSLWFLSKYSPNFPLKYWFCQQRYRKSLQKSRIVSQCYTEPDVQVAYMDNIPHYWHITRVSCLVSEQLPLTYKTGYTLMISKNIKPELAFYRETVFTIDKTTGAPQLRLLSMPHIHHYHIDHHYNNYYNLSKSQ